MAYIELNTINDELNEVLNEVNLEIIEEKINLNEDMNSMIMELKRNKIIENIKNLNLFEHQEIFKIIRKDNIKYSENSNGVFVNMNKLSDNTIFEIDRFITYCNTNKSNFQKENAFRTDLKKFVENKISQEKKIEHLCANPNNNIEEQIEQGISYEADSNIEDDFEDIEDIDCSNNESSDSNLVMNNNIDKSIMNDLKII
jgi:hypothetical protein